MPAVPNPAVMVYGVELAAQGLAIKSLVEGGAAGDGCGIEVWGCDFEGLGGGGWGRGFGDVGEVAVVGVVVVERLGLGGGCWGSLRAPTEEFFERTIVEKLVMWQRGCFFGGDFAEKSAEFGVGVFVLFLLLLCLRRAGGFQGFCGVGGGGGGGGRGVEGGGGGGGFRCEV